jgi:hypothetical protein
MLISTVMAHSREAVAGTAVKEPPRSRSVIIVSLFMCGIPSLASGKDENE